MIAFLAKVSGEFSDSLHSAPKVAEICAAECEILIRASIGKIRFMF